LAVRRGFLLALAVVFLGTCNQAILTAPAGSTLFVFVNPPFVAAQGGTAVVSALVVESIGTPVADGTVVQFFTNLGRIEEQGKTNDGVARVNFVSDTRSGLATVTARSGAVSAETTIAVGGELTLHVLVTAEPRRIVDSRSSQITATVLDSDGNPVPNIGVYFTVSGPGAQVASTEFLDSGGRVIFTDNDGRARDVLRTRWPRDAAAKTVTVTATTADGDDSGDTTVTIN